MDDIFDDIMKTNKEDSFTEPEEKEAVAETPSQQPTAEPVAQELENLQKQASEYGAYLDNLEKYEEAFDKQKEFEAEVERARNGAVNADGADAANPEGDGGIGEDELDAKIAANQKNLSRGLEAEKTVRNAKQYYQNLYFNEPVYNAAVQKKISRFYRTGRMTPSQEEYMELSPEEVCGSAIKSGEDLQKQEESFATTPFGQKLSVLSAGGGGLSNGRAMAVILYAVIFGVLALIGLAAWPFAFVFVAGFAVCLAGIMYLILSAVRENSGQIIALFFIVAAILFIIFCFTPLADFWNNNGGPIPRLILFVASIVVGCFAIRRVANFRQSSAGAGSQNDAEFFQEVEGDPQIYTQMYCYLNHDMILQYLNETVNQQALQKADADLQKVTGQLKKLEAEKQALEQEKARRSKNKDTALGRMRENEGALRSYNSALLNWNGIPLMDDRNPKFYKEIAVKQGPDGNDLVFILRHNLERVNIQYSGVDSDADICTVLLDLIWRLEEGLERINAPELLQIHIIDEKGGGQAVQIDPRFIKRLHMIEQTGQYEPGTYVYGSNLRMLLEYLNSQWNAIMKYRQENADRLDPDDAARHPQDEPIYSANKLRRMQTGGIAKVPPFAYKVLFILVPRAEDEFAGATDIKELLNLIDQPICKSGIIPIFFSNRDSVNEKYQKYVSRCTRCYKADLSGDTLREERGA